MDNNLKDRVTIYEVARAAGVSLATVSRVINKQPNVTEKTRKHVEETIARLAYKPSALAQGLATNKSTNIGIVIPSTDYSYLSNMLSGMVDIGKIYGYLTTLFITGRSKEDAQGVIEKLITSHVDGAVIFDDELGPEEIAKVQSYNIPLIVIGGTHSSDQLASITLDYSSTLVEIMRNYFESGDKNIVVLNNPFAGRIMASLQADVQKAADLFHRSVEVVCCDDSYQRTYNDFMTYFKTHRTGYFIAPRDSLAAAVLNAALDSGLRIPEDVEVLSVIGTKYSFISRPKISALDIDMFEVGSIAMRMLTKLLTRHLEQKEFIFKSSYIQRGSTKK